MELMEGHARIRTVNGAANLASLQLFFLTISERKTRRTGAEPQN